MGCATEEIRLAAYYLWESRGRVAGYDQADWYAAERLAANRGRIPGTARPPHAAYAEVQPDVILKRFVISHAGAGEFFTERNLWIETNATVQTIFEYDRNRRLHFDEGFLTACHRVFKDRTISSIHPDHHFPYKDLVRFRSKVSTFRSFYLSGKKLPPPLFYYAAPHQLEILDGVHRCVAAFDAGRTPDWFSVWVGFNRDALSADAIVSQLWVGSIANSKAAVIPSTFREEIHGRPNPRSSE
jgi:hypothetical protein